MSRVCLSLGSNIGDRRHSISIASGNINDAIGKIISSSSFYETEPWGFNDENFFLNQCIMIETTLTPENILKKLLSIEEKMGRAREGKGYTSRIIDLDILFYDDMILETPQLIIPHPLLHKRCFVLMPLAEIAPEMIHPVLKKTIHQLLRECDDKMKVELFK
jgi:2-amino-4-hydroxy-6-hydroxymethyldihydropteridine diphosphokinase